MSSLSGAERFGGVLLLCIMASGSAMAQEPTFLPEATADCVSAGVERAEKEACLGKSAEVCFSAPGGYSNYAIGFCFSEEWRYWDARLNAAYAALRDAESGMMAEMAEIGATVPDTVTPLRDMQRAWIAWRDAACAYEYATWGGGSGGGPANAECLMQITGRQALALEERLEERGN